MADWSRFHLKKSEVVIVDHETMDAAQPAKAEDTSANA
jgi:hypothetical protein